MLASDTKSRFQKLGLVSALALFVGFPAVSPKPSAPQGSPVDLAREFLVAIYPELKGKKFVLTLASRGPLDESWNFLSYFSAVVRRFPEEQPLLRRKENSEVEPVADPSLLSARFSYDSKGQITSFTATDGTIIRHEANQKVMRLVDTHPRWSDEQVVRTLKQAGARFGPNEKGDFIKILPVGSLERFLGKVTVESVEFKLRLPEDSPSRALLYWSVELRTAPHDLDTANYALSFEPFDGKLRFIWRRSAGSVAHP